MSSFCTSHNKHCSGALTWLIVQSIPIGFLPALFESCSTLPVEGKWHLRNFFAINQERDSLIQIFSEQRPCKAIRIRPWHAVRPRKIGLLPEILLPGSFRQFKEFLIGEFNESYRHYGA